MHKDEEGDQKRKKTLSEVKHWVFYTDSKTQSKTVSEVKPIENISEKMQSLLEISLV